MSFTIRQVAVFSFRRVVLSLALLCLGCSAQSSNNTDINRKIEKHIRANMNIPASVKIEVGEKKQSTDFPNFESVPVTFSQGERKQTADFLLSKDGNTLMRMSKFDISKDPYADVVSKINTEGRPTRGPKEAKVVIVNYDDYQCPFCARMYSTLFNEVLKDYGDKVKVVMKDYPLFEIHPWAGHAAINGMCLAGQSNAAFWEYSDYVHENQQSINGTREQKRTVASMHTELDRIAKDAGTKHGLDATKLEACIKAQPDEALVASVKEAETLGVQATPTLFINGQKIDGAVPASELRAVIDNALLDAGEKPPTRTSASQ